VSSVAPAAAALAGVDLPAGALLGGLVYAGFKMIYR